MPRPKCPNHLCECDPSGEPRIWICPISSYRFELDSDEHQAELRYDKYGRPMTTFTLKPLDGPGG